MTRPATVIVTSPTPLSDGQRAVHIRLDDGTEHAATSPRFLKMGAAIKVRPHGERFVVEDASA